MQINLSRRRGGPDIGLIRRGPFTALCCRAPLNAMPLSEIGGGQTRRVLRDILARSHVSWSEPGKRWSR